MASRRHNAELAWIRRAFTRSGTSKAGVSGSIHSRQIVARSSPDRRQVPPRQDAEAFGEFRSFHDETVCFHDALLRPREELMLRVNATP